MSLEQSRSRSLSRSSPIERTKTAVPPPRFPLLDRISYARNDFPLLESITGGRSPDRRLQRLLSLARANAQERSSRRNLRSHSTPQSQSILWSPSRQHRTWTSHLWLSYVSAAERSPTAPSEVLHPEWVSVFSPEDSCLHEPIKPVKNKEFFKRFVRRKVKVYIAPNDITPESTWARGGPSVDVRDSPRASFDRVFDESADSALDASILRSLSEEDHVKVAERIEHLLGHQIAMAKEDWTAHLLSLRKAAASINEEDLRWLDAMRIPNDVTIAMVGYVCVLFGIAPRWTQAKRSLLNDIPSFLQFLQKVFE